MFTSKLWSNGISKEGREKQLEQDLLQYQVWGVPGRSPTNQEVEQARMYINVEHTKKLQEELPYITRYFETIPIDLDTEDNDGLSESSADLMKHVKNGLKRNTEN